MENQSKVRDFSGRGDSDASGRGSIDAGVVAQDGQAQANMATLRPGGGSWDAALRAVMGGQQMAQPQQEEDTEEDTYDEDDTDDTEEATEDTEEDIDDTEDTESNKKMKTENYIQALFAGEQLSEEFKTKAKTIFEAAVSARVADIEKNLIEASAAVVKEETEAAVVNGLNHLTEAVDGYLTEVSREWLKENQVEVERGLRTEIAENFIAGLKQLFENSYVEVPETKVDLVDDLFEQNSKLEKSLNEAIESNIELKSRLVGQLCAEQFAQISEDLTDTETEKLAKLAENLDFESIEQYGEKVKLLKESYFGPQSSQSNAPVDVSGSSPSSINPLMEGYVAAISRQLKISGKRVENK